MSGSGGGEFDYIREHLRPLTQDDPAALALSDDAAVLTPKPGRQQVLASDMLVEGRHFLSSDSPAVVAARCLRSNLSDLAAMGASARGYLCSVAWPDDRMQADREAFAAALAREGDTFDLPLLGGDTTAGSSQWVISLTLIGEIPDGQVLRRSGASAGDDVWVSGTIGDAALGLEIAAGRLDPQDALRRRYEFPEPRLALGEGLRGIASACIDVSDGLVADLGQLAKASEVGIEIEAAMVPLSDPVLLWLEKEGTAGLMRLLSAGDDYELVFTAPHANAADVLALQDTLGVQISWTGQVQDGQGIRVRDEDGVPLLFETPGFTHF